MKLIFLNILFLLNLNLFFGQEKIYRDCNLKYEIDTTNLQKSKTLKIYLTNLENFKLKIPKTFDMMRIQAYNLEKFDENSESKIFFDKTYPDRMENIFWEIIEKYTKNKQNRTELGEYVWSPDIDPSDEGNLAEPYMDTVNLRKSITIGANTKNIYLNSNRDWTKVKISPKLNLESISWLIP